MNVFSMEKDIRFFMNDPEHSLILGRFLVFTKAKTIELFNHYLNYYGKKESVSP